MKNYKDDQPAILKASNSSSISINKKDNIKHKNIIRQITALVLLLIIVPITLFAGLNPYFYNLGYQYFFITILALLFCYGIFEITNFIFPYKSKEFKQNFYFLAFFYTIPFLFWAIEFFKHFNPDYYLSGQLFTSNNSDSSLILYFFVSLIFITMAYILYSAIFPNNIKDNLTIVSVILLLFGFFTSIYMMLAIFNWSFFFLFIFTVAIIDTSAYFTGNKFGKNKLSPKNSPNKTLEGALSASFIGFLFALCWFFGIIYPQNLQTTTIKELDNFYSPSVIIWIINLLLLVCIFEQLADISFSKIKRSYNKKDFSNILPGHGGLLDRIDGHIFTILFSNLFLIVLIL